MTDIFNTAGCNSLSLPIAEFLYSLYTGMQNGIWSSSCPMKKQCVSNFLSFYF